MPEARTINTSRSGTWPTVGYSASATISLMVKLGGLLVEPPPSIIRRLNLNVSGALNDVIGGAYRGIRTAIPVRHKDGQRSQVKFEPARIGLMVARAHTESKIMVFLEKNTAAHEIRPRNAKALRFVKRGKVIFARRVQHPGTRGKHMWQRADAQVRTRLFRAVEAAITATLLGTTYRPRYGGRPRA